MEDLKNNVLKPVGDYKDPVKITENDVEKIASELETTVSDDTRLMQEISENGVYINEETGMTEAISDVAIDTETGLMDVKVTSKVNNSATIEEIINGNDEDFLSKVQIDDSTYDKAAQLFDLKDAKEALNIVNVVKRFKEGEKFDYYEELPPMLKRLAATMASGAGISKKEAAKDILGLAAQDLEIDQAFCDFNQLVKKELQLPNMVEMYADALRDRIEVDFKKLAEKLEADGNLKKANVIRGIIEQFGYTYNFDLLFDFANNNKTFVRKLKKETKRWKRWVTEFNYKYKESKFTIPDITLIINAMMRSLETEMDIDQATKILVLIVKSVQNYDANDIEQHSYMFYLIYHFICLDHVAPGKSEFMDTFKANILNLAQLIEYIENEKV